LTLRPTEVTDWGIVVTRSAAVQSLGNEMTNSDDFTKMTDPEFLAERRLVREELEHTPEFEVSATLTERYERLNEEFLRRARISWAGGK